MFVLFILTLSSLKLSQGCVFECEFNHEEWINLGVVFQCKVKGMQVTSRERLTEVTGNSNYIPISHVKALDIQDQRCQFVPSDVQTFFPSLEGLQVANSELKELESADMQQFPNLKQLFMSENELQSLENNVFEHCPNIEYINLGHNNIMHMGTDIFAPLKNLQYCNVVGNNCIDTKMESPNAIQTFSKAVEKQCPPTPEMLKREKERKIPESLRTLAPLMTSTVTPELSDLKEELRKLKNVIAQHEEEIKEIKSKEDTVPQQEGVNQPPPTPQQQNVLPFTPEDSVQPPISNTNSLPDLSRPKHSSTNYSPMNLVDLVNLPHPPVQQPNLPEPQPNPPPENIPLESFNNPKYPMLPQYPANPQNPLNQEDNTQHQNKPGSSDPQIPNNLQPENIPIQSPNNFNDPKNSPNLKLNECGPYGCPFPQQNNPENSLPSADRPPFQNPLNTPQLNAPNQPTSSDPESNLPQYPPSQGATEDQLPLPSQNNASPPSINNSQVSPPKINTPNGCGPYGCSLSRNEPARTDTEPTSDPQNPEFRNAAPSENQPLASNPENSSQLPETQNQDNTQNMKPKLSPNECSPFGCTRPENKQKSDSHSVPPPLIHASDSYPESPSENQTSTPSPENSSMQKNHQEKYEPNNSPLSDSDPENKSSTPSSENLPPQENHPENHEPENSPQSDFSSENQYTTPIPEKLPSQRDPENHEPNDPPASKKPSPSKSPEKPQPQMPLYLPNQNPEKESSSPQEDQNLAPTSTKPKQCGSYGCPPSANQPKSKDPTKPQNAPPKTCGYYDCPSSDPENFKPTLPPYQNLDVESFVSDNTEFPTMEESTLDDSAENKTDAEDENENQTTIHPDLADKISDLVMENEKKDSEILKLLKKIQELEAKNRKQEKEIKALKL